jgi:DNA-binding NarL/FixJ family response regulator
MDLNTKEISTEVPKQLCAAGCEPLCLWIVDDQDSVLKLLSELLGKNTGIDCARQFHSAEAALDALANETPPDALLTDVNMRGMSGIDSIAPIKRLAASTRVFIMTTFYDSELMCRARHEGAAGFFLKSGDWEEIIARMANSSADWKAEDAERLPVQWEMDVEEFSPAMREKAYARLDRTGSAPAKALSAAARENHPHLLTRLAAMMRALFNRDSCQQRPAP